VPGDELYYHLRLTREVEQVLTNLYRQNKVIGGLYRSLGQEAVAVGSAYALRRREDGTGDVIAPAIRNLGSLLMMGARPSTCCASTWPRATRRRGAASRTCTSRTTTAASSA
jgi:TPP-dependent pyruvate/acetoin dehydrogenase alpha subunit